MLNKLHPLEHDSLKQKFIRYFENLILSGELTIGDKLPPERELAKKLKISRPIIHEGLIELAAKGLIKIIPRKGSFINNYLREGSIGFLEALLHYNNYKLSDNILNNFLEIRMIFEKVAASKAAIYRTDDNLKNLKIILEKENRIVNIINNYMNKKDIIENSLKSPDNGLNFAIKSFEKEFAQIDFDFHLEIMLASNNFLFPLLSNSFKEIYISILTFFYSNHNVIKPIHSLHNKLFKAISQNKSEESEFLMHKILSFGEKKLKEMYKGV